MKKMTLIATGDAVYHKKIPEGGMKDLSRSET